VLEDLCALGPRMVTCTAIDLRGAHGVARRGGDGLVSCLRPLDAWVRRPPDSSSGVN
jgi:hypothetical protein